MPSYELWKVLLDENKRLKYDVGNLGYKIKNQRQEINNLLKENTKLKELLKECRERLIYCTISTQDVQAKINQVLGEE